MGGSPADDYDVVVCGAGIAGVSAAYHLAVRHGLTRVLVVDDRPPLSLTSDKSTECFRNWWPGPGDAMVRLTNRTIDLLEELDEQSGGALALHLTGYAYFTARPEQAEAWARGGDEPARLGAGPWRVHERLRGPLPDAADGADLVLDRDWVRQRYPCLTPDVVAMLQPRRCGWLSAQQLGMYLMERAREAGVTFRRARLTGVDFEAGRVAGVRLDTPQPERVRTGSLVVAAGPHTAEVAALAGVQLPLFNELHGKVTFDDRLAVVPRDLPLMIWCDPVRLPFSADERRDLEADPELRWLLDELPAGVHFRPEGGADSRMLLLLWTYHLEAVEPVWPPRFDPYYPQVVLRGLCRMLPGFAAYQEGGPTPFVDGGYYCKTRENRPLIGPLPVPGLYVLGALSGFGIMTSQAAAELLALHVTGGRLPDYATAFQLDRYQDPAYRALLEGWDATAGQL